MSYALAVPRVTTKGWWQNLIDVVNAKLGVATAMVGDVGGTVGANVIGAAKVLTTMIADANVTAAKLAAGAAVSNVGAGGITSNELASNSVTTAKITDANVSAAKLASLAAITNVGAKGVLQANINDLAVGTAQLAAGGVTGPKLAASVIKRIAFTGHNGVGACTATGVAIGDVIISIVPTTTIGEALVGDFETPLITAANQIQQATATDYSLKTFVLTVLTQS